MLCVLISFELLCSTCMCVLSYMVIKGHSLGICYFTHNAHWQALAFEGYEKTATFPAMKPHMQWLSHILTVSMHVFAACMEARLYCLTTSQLTMLSFHYSYYNCSRSFTNSSLELCAFNHWSCPQYVLLL